MTNHDSIIAAGNGGGKPVKARLTFFYAGGAKKYRIEQTIAPDDQMWIDVGKLIRAGIPDKDGNVLPPNLTTGAYRLRGLAETPSPSLYEGKVVTDKTYGHATYGCMVCCGYRAAFLNPDPIWAFLNLNTAFGATGMNACGSGTANLDGYVTSWRSDNTAVMTVQPRVAAGVSVGSTTAGSELVNIQYGPPRDGQTCPVQNVPVQGPGTVQMPHQLLVVRDTTATQNCSLTSVARIITYAVEDTTGAPMSTPVFIHENVPVTSSSCNGSNVTTGTGCHLNNTYAPFILNEFSDVLWAGCPSSVSVEPCGFKFANQQWQYCPVTGPATSIGTIGPVNAGNAIISVDGNTINLTGTIFGP